VTRKKSTVGFDGLWGYFRLVLLGNSLRDHNELSVTDYNSDEWVLAPFPAEKEPVYVADNLATASLSTFRDLHDFQRGKASADSRWGAEPGQNRDISWRLHVAIWCANLALARADSNCCFVELGTGRGYMAAGILSATSWESVASELGLEFYLMDTFLPHWQEENAELNARGSDPFYYANGAEEVSRYFSQYSGVNVVEGLLPESLSATGTARIAFLHVDLNSAKFETLSLHALRNRLDSGSVVLFDDSTNPGCHDQLKAHRIFAESLGTKLLELPTGQSLMIL
jgi:hypothetical protein